MSSPGDGRPFRTNIIGQIATLTCGTKHSAKGTHFTKKNIPLSNSDTVKWKWAISKPTLSSPNLTDIWENQLTSIKDWVSEESKRAATGSKINACITKSANDLQYADLIMLTSQHIYEKPEGVNTNQNATPRRTKRKNVKDSMVEQQSMAASMSSMATSSTNMNIPTPPPDKGALYNPRILPDYHGREWWQAHPYAQDLLKIKARMLVLTVCDAHVYNIVQNGQLTSTFQLGVQAIKVLDPSDEPVEEHMIPVLSTISINMSKDGSAISPSKKKQAHK
ncbi:hypothetical protein BDR07DRAFT_1486226 [Suillus spraguei]|nr:hypothetical protein BDR07DRAFT_1486226 [Suillus spraguei]